MEFNFQVNCTPDESTIDYLDQMCKLTCHYLQIKDANKLCFVIHEALINAVEATKRKYERHHMQSTISLKIEKKDSVEVLISDQVGGLSNETLGSLNPERLKEMYEEERGRGLLLIKQYADDLWYEADGNGNYILGFRKGVQVL